MMKEKQKTRASSTIEYMALIMFLISALLLARLFIVRGFSGRWKMAGDSFGHTRQYDPRPWGVMGNAGGTLSCQQFLRVQNDPTSALWVNTDCFRDCLDGDTNHDGVIDSSDNHAACMTNRYSAECLACIDACAEPLCG